jgi:hypothetical protein
MAFALRRIEMSSWQAGAGRETSENDAEHVENRILASTSG